jgi:hypothetical protein
MRSIGYARSGRVGGHLLDTLTPSPTLPLFRGR